MHTGCDVGIALLKGGGERFLHGELICRYTLSKYISEIHVDSLCIISVKSWFMKNRDFVRRYLIYCLRWNLSFFCVLGKVVVLDRWGGKWNHLSMTPRLTTDHAKNYCNRTLIIKVIVENVVTCFFMGHSVLRAYRKSYTRIDWYQNEWPWPLFRGRIKVTSTIALHLTLNISGTVRYRGLVPKDHQ